MFSWCHGLSAGLRNRSTRVQNPVALLRSLSDKYSWERYKPPYPPNYGLNSTTTVLLKKAGGDLESNNPRRLIRHQITNKNNF